MRSLISSLVVVFAVAVASVGEPEPSPTATASQTIATPHEQTGATETASPSPTVSPVPVPQEPPQVLPESKALPTPPTEPTRPRDLLPEGTKPQIPGSVPNPASAEQLEKDKIRFRQLRTIAVRDPYAIYFLRRGTVGRPGEMEQ